MRKYIHKILLEFLLITSAILVSTQCKHQHVSIKRKLRRLNVDSSTFTITGFSAGGVESIQFHFAHSSRVSGVGIMSAAPYLQGSGRSPLIPLAPDKSAKKFTDVLKQIDNYERMGLIDPTKFLRKSRIFIYHGKKDILAHPENAEIIKKTYEHYGASDIRLVLKENANHGVPVNNSGGPCWFLNLFLVNDCHYDGIFEMYNYLYGGNLQKPPLKSTGTVELKGDLFEFDQSEFFDAITPRNASMDPNVGFVYIPSGCRCRSGTNNCRISFALHGCIQSRYHYGDKFTRTTGYLETAELNNIVIVFPQAYPYLVNPVNPLGCWDYWGVTSPYHGTKLGPQEIILKRMMDKIFSG